MTHRVADIYIPHYRSGMAAWATCDTCPVTVEAMPDLTNHDHPWQALSEAWTRHKGVVPGYGNTTNADRLSKAQSGQRAAAVHRAKVGAF